MKNITWIKQFERVKRHKERVLNSFNSNINDLEDHFINFCIHCFHLYEWIDNDIGNENAKKYALNNEYLVICGGITNHAKHFQVNRFKNDLFQKKDEPYRYVALDLASSSTGYYGFLSDFNILKDKIIDQNDKIIIFVNNKEYKLLDFINKSVEAWEVFIKENNLEN